jgi:hypothetical protein
VATIAGAQSAFAAWQQAVAGATGGKVFTTHGCTWVWHPARGRLMLLFPHAPDPAGLRPGLAEGTRLGAREVSVWLNAGADGSALGAFGFSDASPVLWHAGRLDNVGTPFAGQVRLEADVPEARGADAAELRVAVAWRGGGRGNPDAPGRRRVEHAAARGQDGRLVGRGFAQETESGETALHGLAVAASSRRQGAGRAIATVLADEFSPDVVAGAPPGGAAFLTACGLQLIGRGRHLLLRGPTAPGR